MYRSGFYIYPYGKIKSHRGIKERTASTDKMRAMLTISEKDILHQLEQMTDIDCSVRRDTISALTGLRDGRVLYPLIKALQDKNIGIQQAAMDALIAFHVIMTTI